MEHENGQKQKAERNIRLYAGFQILREPLFWGPILITYIINIGKMELSELYFMEAIVVFGMIFAEVYSSAWADLLGRKKVIVIGSVMTLISMLVFAMANAPIHIWISNTMIMIAFAINSGADDAFLYDSLKVLGREEEHLKINARIAEKRFFLAAISCVASGYLYTIDPRLPMFMAIPGVIASLIFALLFFEPKNGDKVSHKEHFDLMKVSVLFVANNKTIKWIIGYMAILAVSTKLWFFTYNPYFELVELSAVYYGWIFAGLNLIAWVASRYVPSLVKRLGERRVIIWMCVFATFPVILMGTFISKISIGFLFFDSFLRGVKEPFFSAFINRHLDSKNRATVLSIKSSILAFVAGFGLWGFSYVVENFTLGISLQILGVITFVFTVFGVIKHKTIFGK